MVDIKPYHEKTHSCLQDSLMCVAKYFNKNHIYMYTNGLNITLANDEKNIGMIYCAHEVDRYKLVNTEFYDVEQINREAFFI